MITETTEYAKNLSSIYGSSAFNDAAMRERGWDYRLLFLSDHKTLTSTRGHDGDPVPYMLYDSRVDTKAGLPYTEKSGEKGPYVNSGVSLMSILFEK